jgi:drug/metabolite transporter (DMT)-like permease
LGCMEPLTAVCMGVLFLGEHLQPMQIGGIVVVLSAVCIVISGSYIRKWVRDIRLLFMHRI